MTTEAPAAKSARDKTSYVILSRDDSGFWTLLSVPLIEASNANDAVKQVATTAGTFVAIPERSWKPVDVTVETQTIVKVG